MDQARELGVLELRRIVAEDPLHGGAHVAHGRVRVDDHDDVGRILDEGTEPGFGLLTEQILRQGRAVERERYLRRQRLEGVPVRHRERGAAPHDEQAPQLVFHEQWAAQKERGLRGEPQRFGDLRVLHDHLVGAMSVEAVTLPLRQDRQGERDAYNVLSPARGRHHGVVLAILTHQHADHGAFTCDRARRLQCRGVDPLTVRRRHEGRPRPAERSLADRGLLLLTNEARDPDDHQEEEGRRRADQDRKVARHAPEMLDHHHAGSEE